MNTQLTEKQIANGFIKTGEQAKAELAKNGVTLKAWAEKNDYDLDTVYKVVSGARKAFRGVGHEIAVAIGMKAKPDQIV